MSERSVSREVEVPGTPEQVWAAIATGPGISAWFVPTEVDGRPGGTVTFQLGVIEDATAKVTGWEPPTRFAYEEPWPGADGVTLATEFLVEARAGGTCVVRVVSTFSTDGFDDDLGSLDDGWTGFLDNLRVYLTHFRGRPAATISLTGGSPAPPAEAWAELRAALGLERVAVGTTVAAGGSDGAPPVTGTVERLAADDLLVRSEDGFVNLGVFSWDDQTVVACRETCFGADASARAERRRAAWEKWMAATWAAPSA
jgi:uncharacterized protein YndB with AHSA1/START domain